jgi:hypothetical protein
MMTMAHGRSDEALLSCALEDEDAFAVFYERYERPSSQNSEALT